MIQYILIGIVLNSGSWEVIEFEYKFADRVKCEQTMAVMQANMPKWPVLNTEMLCVRISSNDVGF